MAWTPISEAELKALLVAAVAALSPAQRKNFYAHAVPPTVVMCRRPGAAEDDPVFVIARKGKVKVIFFDDVEDEFGIALDDEPITQWSLVPDLGAAMTELLA
jgi:hypothetical protein